MTDNNNASSVTPGYPNPQISHKRRKNPATKISAEIGKIGREGKVNFSRVHEVNIDAQEKTDSNNGFDGSIVITDVEGTLSLADIIKEKSIIAPKRRIIL